MTKTEGRGKKGDAQMHTIAYLAANCLTKCLFSIILCIYHHNYVLKHIHLIIMHCWKGFGPIVLYLRMQRGICKYNLILITNMDFMIL